MSVLSHCRTVLTPDRSVPQSPTVCVVDPRGEDYDGWSERAEEMGLKLEIVADAVSALRFARTLAVDLWVVNAELPGMSGFELCSMLKARAPAVPVYLVADEYAPTTEQEALAARATIFAIKSQISNLKLQIPLFRS